MKISIKPVKGTTSFQLKAKILNAILDVKNKKVPTWSATKAGDQTDIIYHNPDQYVKDPAKNVIFRLSTEDGYVTLRSSYWIGRNPIPSDDMIFFHIGRLTEMLLSNFRNLFDSIIIKEQK